MPFAKKSDKNYGTIYPITSALPISAAERWLSMPCYPKREAEVPAEFLSSIISQAQNGREMEIPGHGTVLVTPLNAKVAQYIIEHEQRADYSQVSDFSPLHLSLPNTVEDSGFEQEILIQLLNDLPIELFDEICSYLEPFDLIKLSHFGAVIRERSRGYLERTPQGKAQLYHQTLIQEGLERFDKKQFRFLYKHYLKIPLAVTGFMLLYLAALVTYTRLDCKYGREGFVKPLANGLF